MMQSMTNELPPNPAAVYRGHGWRGWAAVLGTDGMGVIDHNLPITVTHAVRPVLADTADPEWTDALSTLPRNLSVATAQERLDTARFYLALLAEVVSAPEAWWERDTLLDALDRLSGETAQITAGSPMFAAVLAEARINRELEAKLS